MAAGEGTRNQKAV